MNIFRRPLYVFSISLCGYLGSFTSLFYLVVTHKIIVRIQSIYVVINDVPVDKKYVKYHFQYATLKYRHHIIRRK